MKVEDRMGKRVGGAGGIPKCLRRWEMQWKWKWRWRWRWRWKNEVVGVVTKQFDVLSFSWGGLKSHIRLMFLCMHVWSVVSTCICFYSFFPHSLCRLLPAPCFPTSPSIMFPIFLFPPPPHPPQKNHCPNLNISFILFFFFFLSIFFCTRFLSL